MKLLKLAHARTYSFYTIENRENNSSYDHKESLKKIGVHSSPLWGQCKFQIFKRPIVTHNDGIDHFEAYIQNQETELYQRKSISIRSVDQFGAKYQKTEPFLANFISQTDFWGLNPSKFPEIDV